MNYLPNKYSRKSGFTLVEVVISLAVFSICILPVMALLLLGMSTSQSSSAKTIASNLAGALVSDLRASTAAGSTTPAAGTTSGSGTALGSGTTSGSGTTPGTNISPRFGIYFPNPTPVTSYTWFDAYGNLLDTKPIQPAGAVFRAAIYVNTVGTNYTAQILITWPASLAPVLPAPFAAPLSPASSYFVVTNF